METMGNRIRQAREARGMSQAELARRIGITRQGMCAIEQSEIDPRAGRIREIANVLRVSGDYLLGLQEEDARYSKTINA
jgi:transcriptional regulator with XRE-family HTH domain